MEKNQIDVTFTKEELDILRLIILERKSYYLQRITSCYNRIEREKNCGEPSENVLNSQELERLNYQMRYDLVSKFYEFLLKWGVNYG